MSEDIDPAARAAYDWTHLTRDIAVSTSLTLHDASKLTSQLQHGFTLSEGLKVTMLGHVVPYDIAQPLIRLLEAARSGEYATVGANLRALMTQAQDAVRPHPDPANEGQH